MDSRGDSTAPDLAGSVEDGHGNDGGGEGGEGNRASPKAGGERVLYSSKHGRAPDIRPPKGKTVSNRTDSIRSELANTLSSTAFGLGRSVAPNEVFEIDAEKKGPSGGPGSGTFPPAYNIIRAGKHMRLNATRLHTVAGLDRRPTKIGYPSGGLIVREDDRAFCAQNYHCAEKGANMSLSVAKPTVGGGGGGTK